MLNLTGLTDRTDLCRRVAACFPAPQVIVEVGVEKGLFSQEILELCPAAHAWLVDPWAYQAAGYQDGCNVAQEAQDALYALTCSRLRAYGSRATVVRDYSVAAAATFPDETAHLVYIDGNHAYDAVVADLAAWWPKIVPGGVLAGHDYTPGEPHIVGVIPAVNEFVARHGLTLHLVTNPADPSWAVVKPETSP